jgi:two-component system chemotaxis response regulator CheB
MTPKARVLVVDDSPTMRGLIKAVLRSDPGIDVVGEAGDAHGGASRHQAAQSRCDHARYRDAGHERPGVSRKDHEAPADAGDHGLDPDPARCGGHLGGARDRRVRLCRQAGAGRSRSLSVNSPKSSRRRRVRSAICPIPISVDSRPLPQAYSAPSDYQPARKIIAIGASTGGVEALIAVLTKFPANCPPTVITQHMPATFTKSFAERLDRLCAPEGQGSRGWRPAQIGRIYLAPGG